MTANKKYPTSTLVYLESSWKDVSISNDALLHAAFLMGLEYPGTYWVELALGWAEQGFPISEEAAMALRLVASARPKQLPQNVRHRAHALVCKLERGAAVQQGGPVAGESEA